MIEVITVILFGLLVVTAIAAIRLHDLFAVVMIFSIYSLLAAAIFVAMDAVDVAFTEAAVGVGISTVLMLATIGLVGRHAVRATCQRAPLRWNTEATETTERADTQG